MVKRNEETQNISPPSDCRRRSDTSPTSLEEQPARRMVFMEQDLVKSKCLPQERKDTPTYWRHVYIEKTNLHMLEINHEVSKMETNWNSINWSKIHQRVSRIQSPIYKRTLEGQKVHELQRVCTSLLEAKLLAYRRVTQDHKGKQPVLTETQGCPRVSDGHWLEA
jgi:hypothetical protein